MKFFGKYRGIVFDNKDPECCGKIRALVPSVLGNMPSKWALPCVPFAGLGSGAVFIPSVGNVVWIEFENGSAEHPIWVGSFWPKIKGKGSIPFEAKVKRNYAGEPFHTPCNYVFKSPGGHLIEICDVPEIERIRIRSALGLELLLDESLKNGKISSVVRLLDLKGQKILILGRDGEEKIQIFDKKVDGKRQEVLFDPVNRFFRIREVQDLGEVTESTIQEILIDNKSGQEKIRLRDKEGDEIIIDAVEKKISIVSNQDKVETIGKDWTVNVVGNVNLTAEKVVVHSSDVHLGGEAGEKSARKGDGIIGVTESSGGETHTHNITVANVKINEGSDKVFVVK